MPRRIDRSPVLTFAKMTQSSSLSPAERAILATAAGLMIPADPTLGMPAASDPVILADIESRIAEILLSKLSEGKQVIMSDLCARFGKTIWAGVLARELESRLIVIASYVLTSFASFEKAAG